MAYLVGRSALRAAPGARWLKVRGTADGSRLLAASAAALAARMFASPCKWQLAHALAPSSRSWHLASQRNITRGCDSPLHFPAAAAPLCGGDVWHAGRQCAPHHRLVQYRPPGPAAGKCTCGMLQVAGAPIGCVGCRGLAHIMLVHAVLSARGPHCHPLVQAMPAPLPPQLGIDYQLSS